MKRITALFISALLVLSAALISGGAEEKITLIIQSEKGFDKALFCDIFNGELVYTYESINSFAVCMNESLAGKIYEYPGIISATRDFSFPGPGKVEELEDMPLTGGYTLFAEEEEEYMGEGMLVAVIDAGCNISHEAFPSPSSDVALTEEEVSLLFENQTFNAENMFPSLTGKMVYHNKKFPFAFDYGDGDYDVYGASHGTGVCSVLAGNGGSYNGKNFHGALPEAQIVMMKVQDASGAISVSDMLAAVEDAILLGVDGINISIGSVSGFGGTPNEAAFEGVINKAREKGIFVSVSAGNSGMFTAEGGFSGTATSYLKPFNANTDYGITASPAVYENAVAVASCSADGVPSVFSAWGGTNEGELKPDVSAGGNAVTVATNSGFTVSRGTSYSSPLLLGNAIKVKHKYEERGDADGLSEKLIMNTADIMRENGIPVSPRKQGSGMLNLSRALGAKCVIYGNGGKAKINLGDNLGESFSGEFTVENISGYTVEYVPSLELITDKTDGERITGKSVFLKNTTVFNPSVITVGPGEKVKVSFTVETDPGEIKENAELFPNGFYLEGFISLSGTELLSIPFSGYRGSWDAAPLFIPPAEKYGFGFATVMMNRAYTFENTYYYGNRFFPHMGLSSPHLSIENIAFSPNGDKLLDTANIFAGLYRNVLSLKLSFKDSSGNTVYEIARTEVPKGHGLSTIAHTDYRWDGKDFSGNPCAEGQYYMVAEALGAYEGATPETLVLPLFIDRTKPSLKSVGIVKSGERIYLDVGYEDNGTIQAVAISGKGFTDFSYGVGESGAYRFDITDIKEDTFDIEAFDYALNGSLDEITVADEYRVYYKDKEISRISKKTKAYINGTVNREYELKNGEDGFRLLIWNKNLMPVF